VMQGFDYSRALIGLQCCGAAQASLDEAWAYARSARHSAADRPVPGRELSARRGRFADRRGAPALLPRARAARRRPAAHRRSGDVQVDGARALRST
jgi:hypothetical protein